MAALLALADVALPILVLLLLGVGLLGAAVGLWAVTARLSAGPAAGEVERGEAR